ncbi:MAG: bacterial Ig-like domain-containing protein, partial [Ruminococcus sp.]
MRTKRFLSILLSMLMVCSIFGGLSVSAASSDYATVNGVKANVGDTVTIDYFIKSDCIWECFQGHVTYDYDGLQLEIFEMPDVTTGIMTNTLNKGFVYYTGVDIYSNYKFYNEVNFYRIKFTVRQTGNYVVNNVLEFAEGNNADMIVDDGVILNTERLKTREVVSVTSKPTEPEEKHTYTVVGDAAFLSAFWNPATVADDMTLQKDGTYKITYTGVAKSDCYTIKVAQDHAWDVCFGANLGDPNPANIEFSVPEDNSTVDIILTLQGTRDKDGVEIPDGFVKVLVNGTDAPGKVVPYETTHYVVGEAGLCNGVAWNQADETNKMTKNEDGSYEITFKNVQPKEDGTAYQFKVTTNGAWEPAYDYNGEIAPGMANAELAVTKADSEVRIVLTADLKVKVYVNGEDVTPKPTPTTTRPLPTTNNKGEISDVTSLGGIYTGPTTGGSSTRFFFAMPKDWYTFSNSTACAYWWKGTDKCTDWQHSYQMRSTLLTLEDGARVYYIDIPSDVEVIIFNNGIDGGIIPSEGEEIPINWGENYHTVDINLGGYDPNERETYPDGLRTFKNMVYVVDSNSRKFDCTSGAEIYSGEWYYLHADGKWDSTPGTTYEIYNRLLVSNLPDKITYIEGEDFDATGLEVMALTDDGESDIISDDLYTLDVPDKFNIGKNTITVKFRDLTTTFNVFVTPKDIRGIKVYEPYKTKYTEGEELDLDGMIVLAYYEDGSTGFVDDYEVSGYDSTIGEKIIEVTCRGKKAYFTVTVSEKPIKSILVSSTPIKTDYYVGDEIDTTGLEVYVYYRDNTSKKITNYTLDYDFSKTGKQFVTVDYKGYTDQFIVNVEPKVEPTTEPTVNKVTKVSLSKNSVTLFNGKSFTVKATVTPNNATNKKLKWTTSNSKVAVVNSQGKINAKGRGTATIKVMALDGSNKYATIKVTVKQPVTSIKLNKKSATLKVKGNAKQKTVTLKATVNPKNANVKSVKWTTSKSKIATVNSKGKVTAKKKGTCFIYATA